MARVTVAVCARKAQDIIGGCLESILNQTEPADAIIVAVDDLSDPTASVAERYGARVIASGSRGLYEARNAVLNDCETEYVGFTDADCVLVPEWIALAKSVLDSRLEFAAVTGRHPPLGRRNFASWLHHMWYVVETTHTGETSHVIGGNSFFRTDALRQAGGWLSLPGHSAAEDIYISEVLRRVGYRIWFEERAAAWHHYETRMRSLWNKSVMMGRDIVVMMRAADLRGRLWWHTLAIPVAAAMALTGSVIAPWRVWAGLFLLAFPLVVSFGYLWSRFGTIRATVPRWAARWVLIWPYSLGVIQGLIIPIPEDTGRKQADG